jgi:hypothetical protein
MSIEYRICWAASSNARFRGHDDWNPWDDEDATGDEVEDALSSTRNGHMNLPDGLEMALEGSGFEWWVETREATA